MQLNTSKEIILACFDEMIRALARAYGRRLYHFHVLYSDSIPLYNIRLVLILIEIFLITKIFHICCQKCYYYDIPFSKQCYNNFLIYLIFNVIFVWFTFFSEKCPQEIQKILNLMLDDAAVSIMLHTKE